MKTDSDSEEEKNHEFEVEDVDKREKDKINSQIQQLDDEISGQNEPLLHASGHLRNQVYETLMKYTGETDKVELPVTTNVLPWHEFNVDFWSTHRSFDEVKEIIAKYPDKRIDLRPYMIEQPFVILTTDSLPKVLNYFRHFHLRALPVIDPANGKPVAVLTRQDIFAFMSL